MWILCSTFIPSIVIHQMQHCKAMLSVRLFVRLFVCCFFVVFVFGFFYWRGGGTLCPIPEFFTQMETSPLTMHGFKFWLILGTHCHWAVRILQRVIKHLLWHEASVYYDHIRGPETLTPVAERLAVQLSLPVYTT